MCISFTSIAVQCLRHMWTLNLLCSVKPWRVIFFYILRQQQLSQMGLSRWHAGSLPLLIVTNTTERITSWPFVSFFKQFKVKCQSKFKSQAPMLRPVFIFLWKFFFYQSFSQNTLFTGEDLEDWVHFKLTEHHQPFCTCFAITGSITPSFGMHVQWSPLNKIFEFTKNTSVHVWNMPLDLWRTLQQTVFFPPKLSATRSALHLLAYK